MSSSSFSLYIHMPFCSGSKCDYCDFYSVPVKKESLTEAQRHGGGIEVYNKNEIIDNYVNAIIKDVEYQIKYFSVKNIVTAYIGGGTPSVLSGKQLGKLLGALNSLPCFKPVEFTVEANPESITQEFLAVCLEGGINRLSLGVQTFHEPSRKAVNRKGSIDMMEKNLGLASRFFPGLPLSCDLVTGFPYQNTDIVREDIQKLLCFNVNHVSLYSLTVEEGTALEENIKEGKITVPGKEESDDLWLAGRDALLSAGFDHYEVSSFALYGENKNRRCLHNIRYWRMENWLGAGASASGTVIKGSGTEKMISLSPDPYPLISAFRYTHVSDLHAYIKNPQVRAALREDLDRDTLAKETLMTGFRYKEGPDTELFERRFGCKIEDVIPATLAKWKNKDKMLFLNSFLQDAFTELDIRNSHGDHGVRRGHGDKI